MCPVCWSDLLKWIEASGKGEIVSYSIVHRPSEPSFFAEAPLVLAEVSLDEGPAMLARIICHDIQGVRSGLKVEVRPLAEAKKHPLPAFRARV